MLKFSEISRKTGNSRLFFSGMRNVSSSSPSISATSAAMSSSSASDSVPGGFIIDRQGDDEHEHDRHDDPEQYDVNHAVISNDENPAETYGDHSLNAAGMALTTHVNDDNPQNIRVSVTEQSSGGSVGKVLSPKFERIAGLSQQLSSPIPLPPPMNPRDAPPKSQHSQRSQISHQSQKSVGSVGGSPTGTHQSVPSSTIDVNEIVHHYVKRPSFFKDQSLTDVAAPNMSTLHRGTSSLDMVQEDLMENKNGSKLSDDAPQSALSVFRRERKGREQGREYRREHGREHPDSLENSKDGNEQNEEMQRMHRKSTEEDSMNATSRTHHHDESNLSDVFLESKNMSNYSNIDTSIITADLYDDDWMHSDDDHQDNDDDIADTANRVADHSLHGALSSALNHSVVDSDSAGGTGDTDHQGVGGSTLDTMTRGTLTSALAESVASGTTGTRVSGTKSVKSATSLKPTVISRHHVNNSLIDPLVDTPVAQILDRPPTLEHSRSVGNSGDENEDIGDQCNMEPGNVHDL